MEITNVRVTKNKEMLRKSSIRAFVEITLDDVFVVRNLKLIEGKKGIFLAFPSQVHKSGARSDIAFPIKKEFRQKIVDAVMDVYYNSKEDHPGKAETQEVQKESEPKQGDKSQTPNSKTETKEN